MIFAKKLSLYLSLIRFNHTVFAMPFAMLGTAIAYLERPENFTLEKFIYIVLCMVFARTSAMAFNRYLDKDIDALNPRTKNREIPAGKVKPFEAMLLTIMSSGLFVLFSYLINPLCFYLSPVALLVILGYSYTKRFTWLCHIFLGLGLSFAPVGAYIAITGEINLISVLLGIAVLLWVSGFDIIYALQDEEFDKEHHLFSVPSFFGRKTAIYISRFLHLISVIILFIVYFLFPFGILYMIGWVIFCVLLLYEHYLVTPKDISKIPFAFGILNGWAGLVFGLFGIIDVLIK
jgi:4-hydroxybenzoate polyprenyltransferase